MAVEAGFLQPLWLMLLPLPAIWLFARRQSPGRWPGFLPMVAIRYPPLYLQRSAAELAAAKSDNRRADKLLAISMSLMLVSAAQPVRYTGSVASGVETEPVDLIIVVGTAVTMALRDYVIDDQPVDRMSMVRRLLDRFVTEYSGRRLGLVILGNPPMLWLPLTHDKMAVRDAIGRIRPTLGGRLTDMGATFDLIGDSFADSSDTAVVVVTDGGLQLGATSPQAGAKRLADKGFRVYIIGVGATDPGAAEQQPGSLLYEPLELAPLQALAKTGNGQLFHARDTGAFNDALVTIETRHRRPVVSIPEERNVEPWYWLPLAWALLLLLIAAWSANTDPRGAH